MNKLRTRRPTGKPSWPLLLLAGGEKCGKSYAAAAFSASDLIDRTFWIEIGEGSADQYGALPGARYEIVDHDGSFPSMLEAAKAAVAEPARGKPHAIVIDSMTELWDLLCREQEAIATSRGKKTITMDQWNAAKRRWREFVDVLRHHRGPVIMTARFEQVTVMDPKTKQPTEAKEWKVRAEKNLSYEVDGIVQMPHPRVFVLTGMRSLRFRVPPGGHLPMPDDFTLDWFLRELGIAGNDAPRNYTAPQEDLEGAAAGLDDESDRVTAAAILGAPPASQGTVKQPDADPDQTGWPAPAQPGHSTPKGD